MKEIVITTTVLILCILLIRRIFRGKISSRLQYALWLLVALRLLIPVSAQFDLGPLSGFRLMDLVEEDVSGISQRLEETIRLEEPIQMTVDSRSILFRLLATDEIRGTLEGMPDDGPTAVFMAGRLGFSWLDVLWFLWGIGAFVVGIWILITNMVFSRRLRKMRQKLDLPEEVRDRDFFRRKGRMPAFYLAEGISSPCLYGVPGHEAVYLTADVADDIDKLRHVIVHELVHKKHGDSFWALLRGVLVTVYWFHPLVWVAAVCSKRDCELACDESALAMLGEAERISYGETLLSIITRNGRASDLVCTATTMTGSGKSVKERIRFIAKEPKIFYAAVAGVLFLIAALSLFVFTKDAGFHGITVDSQEGLTVTGADMQISLPASIGGISGCVVEKESDDVVIYHIAAQKEVGRFSKMPLLDALKLVDDEREVIPIGNNSYNYLLRAYQGEPLSRTEHTYTPAGYDEFNEILSAHQGEPLSRTEHTYTPAEENEGEGGVPGTDSNEETTYIIDDDTDWEVHPLEEERDYLPNEEIIIREDAATERVTMHTYTPADGESQGVLGHEDVYSSEEKVDYDYLPNETITMTYHPSETVNVDELDSSGCYVYVRADFYGKVKDKYQEEMAFIDGELKTLINQGDQVIILSLNRKRREALFDALTQNRTPYLGDNSKVGALLAALPLPPTLNKKGGFSLQTVEQPYSLRFSYEMSTDFYTGEDQDTVYFNAAMLFYAIGNVEEIVVDVENPSGRGSTMAIYNREKLEKDLPILQNVDYEDDQAFRESLSELYIAVVRHLFEASAYKKYSY